MCSFNEKIFKIPHLDESVSKFYIEIQFVFIAKNKFNQKKKKKF
jgi:hypothetical protein